jgi:hypothetical protein
MGVLRAACALAVLTAVALGASAVAAPVVVKVDLKPLIRAAAWSKVQFAVPVAHVASAANDGHWRKVGNRQEWQYAVQVPTAVSLSFHADKIRLPADAILTVTSSANTLSYRAADFGRPDFWSRVQPGDALQLTLSVASAERGAVIFQIQSLQAGYRALGPQATDHPYYRQLLRQTAAAGNAASCAQNYECSVTAANTPLAQATVAIVVANQFQCTGTLINDVSGDNSPYLLTARHCEDGVLGGGAPANAADITVYWNATTPCGSSLGSIYDSTTVTQTGATTVVEQQDAWLVKLDQNPVVKNAQFAGFDASGAAVQGAYTIHHALGFDKQITTWVGRAYAATQASALGVGYVSNFLETVNAQGNIGPGASGGALINSGNRLVGLISLGIKSDDASGYEACPAAHPVAPNGSNATAYFTALSSVWNSTADTTTTTGRATLKSVLDPTNSGTTIISSTPAVSLNFAATTFSLQDGDPLVLSWNASGATQCRASGGVSGDGWSGVLPASGTVSLTEAIGGLLSYGLTCQFAGTRKVVSYLQVSWYGSTPNVTFDAPAIRWTGAPATLTWTSNLTPCSITGGGLALSNLASSGSIDTTQTSVGDVSYAINCGVGIAATSSTTVTYVTPSLPFRANSTDRLLREPLALYWYSYADSCIPSGGAPNDGWSTSAYKGQGDAAPAVAAEGAFTYTLTCTSGPNAVTESVTVTVASAAPYVNASATPTSNPFTGTPADYVGISWKSNLTDCQVASDPDQLDSEYSTYPLLPPGASDAEDAGTYAPRQPGVYTITVTCNSFAGSSTATATSTPIVVTIAPPPPPTVTIAVDPTTVAQGQPFTVTWSSTNAQNCVATGNAQLIGPAWGLDQGLTPSGSQVLSTTATGTGTLGITCASIDANQGSVSAQTVITSTPPGALTATLSSSPTSLTIGQTFALTWDSTNASACSASGGGANGSPWTGSLSTSGNISQTASTAGTFTYSLVCTSGNQSAQAQQIVVVAATASSGHSGGGALTLLELILLGSLAPIAARHRVNRKPLEAFE